MAVSYICKNCPAVEFLEDRGGVPDGEPMCARDIGVRVAACLILRDKALRGTDAENVGAEGEWYLARLATEEAADQDGSVNDAGLASPEFHEAALHENKAYDTLDAIQDLDDTIYVLRQRGEI